MKKQVTKIELFKQAMNFSAAHFTIFSESERENLHGHNFYVYVVFDAEVTDIGIAFNYRSYKKIIVDICQLLDESLLLPTKNSYFRIEESEEYIHAFFNDDQEKMLFLKRDVKLIPVRNITVEELSLWFLNKLLVYVREEQEHTINAIEVKIFSGPGQSGSSFWQKNE